jgi:putative Mn2+ efflux pump MntP
MEAIIIFLFSTTMTFIGFLIGLSKGIESSEDDVKEAFKRGYIDGYMDAAGKKDGEPYYKDFPKMGIN